MEKSVESGCRYYKICVEAFNGYTEVVIIGSRGTIKAEIQVPKREIAFGKGYFSVWLVRSGIDREISFFIGAAPVSQEGWVALKRSFYPYDAAGMGIGIENFNELVVTVEKVRRPVKPSEKRLLRQSIGCFAGRTTFRNPLFCELRPFKPPLRKYRWWGGEGNLCTDEREYDYSVNWRKKGGY